MLIRDIDRSTMHQMSSRRADSALLEENQSNPKYYRYLFAVFTENVNNILKENKDCFGEMQFHSKIKISREEMEMAESNLQYIFDKNKIKIYRESLSRNIIVKKTYQQYSQYYRETNICLQQKQIDQKAQNHSFLTTIGKGDKHLEKKYSNPINWISSRKKTTPNASNPKSILYLSQTFKTFQQNNKLFKMKTISSLFSEDPEKSKESSFFTARPSVSKEERIRAKINIYQTRKNSRENIQPKPIINQEIILSGDQIIITESHIKSLGQTNKKSTIPQTNKFCTKRVVAIGQPQKNGLDEINKLRQNKNMDVFLWSNPNQMKCFQPRVRCWQSNIAGE